MMIFDEILGIGKELIKRIFPDKEKQAEAEYELKKLESTGQLKDLETRSNAIIAEAKSKDKWTSRARPSFLYVMYIMILMCIPMGILSVWEPHVVAQIETGMKGWLSAIPEPMWVLFGAGYLGYGYYRTKDKQELLKVR